MAPTSGHIMLSYQWDYQNEVRQIRDALKRFGMNVWMDIDKMSGGIYDKMAEAVEGAEIIIVCMSNGYQTSVNCKKEFEYAQVSKKTIIPIKMETGFNASGALGLITAGKLYIDFSNMSKFNENMKSLKKEIEAHMGNISENAAKSQNKKSGSNQQSEGGWQKADDIEFIDHFLVDDNNRPGCLAMKTSKQKWVCAEPDNWTVKGDRPSLGPWEKFSVSSAGGGLFSLKAWTDKYLTVKPDGRVGANAERVGSNEKWAIYVRNNAIALKSAIGKWLSAQPNGDLEAKKDNIGTYEQFYPYNEGDKLWKS